MTEKNYSDRIKVFDTYYNIIRSKNETPSIEKYKNNDIFTFKTGKGKEISLEESIEILEKEANN